MFIRGLASCLILLCALSIGWFFLTRITFQDGHARISHLYCKLWRPSQTLRGPVIFLPGTKGSLLSQDGQQIWLSSSQVLKNGQPLIYDPNEAPVTATGILTRLSFLPGILEYTPYQRIVATLACQPKTYFFAYDWRRDPSETVKLLGDMVERVTRETGQKPSIIAHSLGGLITHAYLKTHTELVDKIVYVGVPFQSGAGFVSDLDQGSSMGLNKTSLSKEAIFSHPASFVLLPHAGQTLYKGKDLMQYETWESEKLSVFRDGVVDKQAFNQTLEKAIAFHRLLDTPADIPNKTLFIIGNCQDTFKAIRPEGSAEFAPGDTRVLEAAAYPVEQERMNKQVFLSCAKHDKQLNDKKVVKEILNFLSQE